MSKYLSVIMDNYSWTFSFGEKECKHLNGEYRTIRKGWFGKRSVFVCKDCGDIFDVKTMKKVTI
jgi:transposase-like protein